MSPFIFPDPSVQSTVTNPATGEEWIFEDGVWMLSDTDNAPTPPTPATDSDELIAALRIEIAALSNDIIDLKAQLHAASINNFLILE